MIVFVAWPTANPARSNAAYDRWRSMGYKVAVATDLPSEQACKALKASVLPMCIRQYEGYYNTMNHLARRLVIDHKADVVVCAGDGILPHPDAQAHTIALAFAAKFPNGYGVMQPLGELWSPSENAGGTQSWAINKMWQTARSDQRCESPWLGRTLIMEAENKNVFYPGYDQYFGDHELHDVASRVGCLWKNPAVWQDSAHWARGREKARDYQIRNFERAYEKDFALYRTRKARNFPTPIITDLDGLANEPGKLVLP